jgi:hypothetical protein
MFRHIVFFRLKPEEKDRIQEAAEKLRSLTAVPVVRSVEVGLDEVKSERSYDIALIVDCDTRADYEVYDKHELHQPIRQFMRSIIEASATVDFER